MLIIKLKDARYSDLRKAIHDKRAVMDSNILADSIVYMNKSKKTRSFKDVTNCKLFCT